MLGLCRQERRQWQVKKIPGEDRDKMQRAQELLVVSVCLAPPKRFAEANGQSTIILTFLKEDYYV
jgi:hypothetical protein